MINYLPKINLEEETKKIVSFIQNTLKEQEIKKVVIGLSGGIDSITSFYLLIKALSKDQIIPVNLPFVPNFKEFETIVKELNIPQENIYQIPIEKIVNEYKNLLSIKNEDNLDKIRLGNIMARTRMIILYDLAKKNNALVSGTENKSEYYLGYFTRFGDEASDFEPIRNFYKTQVYELAKHLSVPEHIINKPPTAGLWQGQTDESEFGFSYQEADQVLYLYYEQKKNIEEIKSLGFSNTEKIINFTKKNEYKHKVPYSLI